MPLMLYNTLTRTKQEFKPSSNNVKMYVCGPTVYNFLHIGNFRGAIFFNLVRNWLEEKGYKVTYVYNYTDVDDKIIKKAQDEGVDSSVISERYIAEFEKDFSSLNLKKHDHNPRVTEFMPDIIKFVEDLVTRKKAYVVEGEVFYSIDSFPEYGKLSGKKLDDLEAGQRVEVDPKKKNPFDFVLWKPSKSGEPSWDSPWGKGRPGWHIECSAMIQKLLGDTIDIHGGGVDLIFPHHENEVAQGEGRTDKCYCNYWMHNNFLNLNDEKMSKSLGNIITAREFVEKYGSEILKYIMLGSHYRVLFNMNQEKLHNTISALARVYTAINESKQAIKKIANDDTPVWSDLKKITEEADKGIELALDDDFNTVEVLAKVFEVIRIYNGLQVLKNAKKKGAYATAKYFHDWILKNGSRMALFQDEPVKLLSKLDQILIEQAGLKKEDIERLVSERAEVRKNKDWKRSDEIRDELDRMGVIVLDSPTGTTWEMKK